MKTFSPSTHSSFLFNVKMLIGKKFLKGYQCIVRFEYNVIAFEATKIYALEFWMWLRIINKDNIVEVNYFYITKIDYIVSFINIFTTTLINHINVLSCSFRFSLNQFRLVHSSQKHIHNNVIDIINLIYPNFL